MCFIRSFLFQLVLRFSDLFLGLVKLEIVLIYSVYSRLACVSPWLVLTNIKSSFFPYIIPGFWWSSQNKSLKSCGGIYSLLFFSFSGNQISKCISLSVPNCKIALHVLHTFCSPQSVGMTSDFYDSEHPENISLKHGFVMAIKIYEKWTTDTNSQWTKWKW